MAIALKVPSLGESVTQATVGAWLKKEGEPVQADEPLVEVESEKATVALELDEGSQAQAQAASPLGSGPALGGSVPAAKGNGADAPAVPAPAPAAESQSESQSETAAAKAVRPERASTSPALSAGPAQPDRSRTAQDERSKSKGPAPIANPPGTRAPPSARRLMAEHGVAVAEVHGSGPGGQVRKEDVLRALDRAEPQPAPPAEARAPAPAPRRDGAGARERVVPMTVLRRTVARRLVEAQHTAAILTTFNEVDMSRVLALRERHGEAFHAKHGVKLGFMSFFVKAAVEALREFPAVNAEVRGTDLVYKDHYDVGVAVGGGKGLVVPVVRDADALSFAEIEKAVADLARRARENRITMDDLEGGTFTISNGGIYGSLLSTPILNPPQSGILGLHKIERRAVVGAGDAVVVRPMMYVALSYDHRIVDGREAVSFLVRVKEAIEDPERLLLEV